MNLYVSIMSVIGAFIFLGMVLAPVFKGQDGVSND